MKIFKREKPRISANKLAEYLDSNAYRRQTIVKEQKYPQGFMTTRYNDARSTIVEYFLEGKGDKKVVEDKIKTLILKTYNSDFRAQDNALSIKALELFVNNVDLDVTPYTVTRCKRGDNKLEIEGVEVSIEPEVLIKGIIRGKEFLGAIKLHFSKTHPLNEKSGKSVATLLHRFLEKNHEGSNIRREFCISLDVFTGEYFVAPQSFKTLRKEINAACMEIRVLWPNL